MCCAPLSHRWRPRMGFAHKCVLPSFQALLAAFASGWAGERPFPDSLPGSPLPSRPTLVVDSAGGRASPPELRVWRIRNPYADSVSQARDEGYLRAAATDSGWVRGERYFLAFVEEVNDPVMAGLSAELLSPWDAFLGKAAAAATLRDLRQKALRRWEERGYPFARIRPEWVWDADSAEANDADPRGREPGGAVPVGLRLYVQKGAGYKFGGFKAFGSATTPSALQRLSLLEVGEAFRPSRLQAAIGRLERTGYYLELRQEGLYRDSVRHFLYPRLALMDNPGNRLGGLLGFDSERPDGDLSGYLDVHLINLFGTARDLDFTFASTPLTTGGSEQEVTGAYREPWLFGSDLSLELRGYLRLQDTVYWEFRREMVFGQPLGFRSTATWSIGDQENQDRTADQRSRAYFSALGWTWDGRDRVPGTRRGGRFRAEGSGWRRETADTSYFYTRWETSGEAFWPLSRRWLGRMGATGGGHWPLRNGANRGELFELGGAAGLRGYREHEIRTGLFGWGVLEAQFLMAGESRLFAFASPGGARTPETQRGWKPLLGYGAGLSVGTRRFLVEIALASNPERSLGEALLHVKALNQF